MKKLILALATVLAACGNDPATYAGYFDDDTDRSSNTTTTTNTDESTYENSHNTTTNNYYHDSIIVVHDTVTKTVQKTVLDTVYVTDTVTVTDTLRTTSTDTLVKTITKHDTIVKAKLDTVRITVRDTVRETRVDTVYSTAQRVNQASPLDTLDELPDGVSVNDVVMKLKGSRLYIGTTKDDISCSSSLPAGVTSPGYAAANSTCRTVASTGSFIIQSEDKIDTLGVSFGSLEGNAGIVNVKPVNGCVGILRVKRDLGKNAYKVCDPAYKE